MTRRVSLLASLLLALQLGSLLPSQPVRKPVNFLQLESHIAVCEHGRIAVCD